MAECELGRVQEGSVSAAAAVGEPDTSYLRVDEKNSGANGFAGLHVGELVNDEDAGGCRFMANLVRISDLSGEPLNKSRLNGGSSHIVIRGISVEGWWKIMEEVSKLSTLATREEVHAKIVALPWITED